MKILKKIIFFILIITIISIIIKTCYYYHEPQYETGKIKSIPINETKKEIVKESINEKSKIISENEEVLIEENKKELKPYSQNVIGYLTVDGVSIENEPVLQHDSDDSYYLTHNEFDEYSVWGTYFVPTNWNVKSIDNLEQVTVIFGHNNGNKKYAKFSVLKQLKDKNFASKNQFIYFKINEELSIWQIFAVADYPIEPNYVIANPEKEYFLEEIKSMKDYSYNEYSLEVTENDKILILSTCTGQQKYDTRFIVCAKLISVD